MELRNLRTFLEVVRQGGFSNAAKTVFATQSTVSKAVKQLEEELGLVLLDRGKHHQTLTSAGEIVLRRAQRMLAERDDLLAELNDLRGLKRGVLRLGMPPVGSARLFAQLFATYRGRYPGVEIQLVEHGSDRLREMLQEGEIEMAALLMPLPEEEFEAERVRLEPIVALIPASHPLAKRDSVSLAELAPLPFLLYQVGFGLNTIIQGACERARFSPNIVARSSQVEFLAELAAGGIGVAFVPRMLAEQFAKPGWRMARLKDPGMVWDLALAWRRDGYLSHAGKAWPTLARESLGAGASAVTRKQ